MDGTLTHCIYALIDPRDNEIRYIGKSVNPEKRLHTHLCAARKGTHTYALRWMKGLLDIGMRPKLDILESEISTDDVDARERFWIAEGEQQSIRQM